MRDEIVFLHIIKLNQYFYTIHRLHYNTANIVGLYSGSYHPLPVYCSDVIWQYYLKYSMLYSICENGTKLEISSHPQTEMSCLK